MNLKNPTNSMVAVLACVAAMPCAAEPVSVVVDLANPLHAISPYIYGSNHEVEGFVFHDARRLGGNRLTPYNWEVDASNAGKDFRHQNDRWLTSTTWWADMAAPDEVITNGTPAGAVKRFHEESLQRGAYSLVTVPMAGYVAADADGPTSEEEAAPSPRWVAVGADSGQPDAMSLQDGRVWADQFVSHLVKTFGNAQSPRGIRGYSLDNEPALWHDTHPRMHPVQVTCEELVSRSIATSNAIKSIDPAAEVFGPALWGMTAYASLSNAQDWSQFKKDGGYSWFIDHYLDAMRLASEAAGVRLLDVLDVHWYTERPKDREWTGLEVSESAKVMHEAGFAEDNWVGKRFTAYLPLLPRLQASIDEYYPGTRIAISEYDWPQTDTVYGGLAQADALGAFGRHNVYLAAYHHYSWEKPDRYVGSAFALYRNVDGRGLGFGETSLSTRIQGDAEVSVYAALDEARRRVHLVVVNREADQATPMTLSWAEAASQIKSVEAYGFDDASPEVRPMPGVVASFETQSIQLSVPPLTATHLVVSLDLK